MPKFGNKLDEILEDKHAEVQALLPRLDELKSAASEREDYRSLSIALGGAVRDHEIDEGYGAVPLAIIAEVKRASPSAGVIAEDFDPVTIAQEYESAGADAISVLTDEKYFQGNLDFLRQIRTHVGLPLLRKDFIIHEAQVYEAAAAGADAILLIVAALEQDELIHLLTTAHQCQMDVLVEVHDFAEMDRALESEARIIGINNRNLRTFEVSLETTERLSQEAGSDIILVSESGIQTGRDAALVKSWGCDAILVGEALMRTSDKPEQIREFKGLAPNEA